VVGGGETRILLQIFSRTVIGPDLLRVHPAQGRRRLRRGQLQRSSIIEQDQIERGVLTAS
jgi:4-hydroxyphenylpyruvate dioxygenase